MDKKRLYHILEWIVAIGALAWLVWKIAVYDDYVSLWTSLRTMGWREWCALSVAVALMPVNMGIEAWKWRTLVPMPFSEAQKQVYYSKLAGLITPWRLGEYPARGVLMEVQSDKVQTTKDIWAKVLSMGAVGSATMTAAIVIAGAVGLAFSPAALDYLGGSYLYSLAVVLGVLAVAYALMPKALAKYAEVNQKLLLISTGQSFVRLLCWCTQLGLVLYALGAITNSQFLAPNGHDYFTIYNLQFIISNLFVYYLLVTVTPNVPVAEVGIRGAWAIVVFGSMNAALAGVLLWAINTLLPCLVWPFLRKNN